MIRDESSPPSLKLYLSIKRLIPGSETFPEQEVINPDFYGDHLHIISVRKAID